MTPAIGATIWAIFLAVFGIVGNLILRAGSFNEEIPLLRRDGRNLAWELLGLIVVVAIVLTCGLGPFASTFPDPSRPWLWPVATCVGLGAVFIAFQAWQSARGRYLANRFMETGPYGEDGIAEGPVPAQHGMLWLLLSLFVVGLAGQFCVDQLQAHPLLALSLIAYLGLWLYPWRVGKLVKPIHAKDLKDLRLKAQNAADRVCDSAGVPRVAVWITPFKLYPGRVARVSDQTIVLDALTVRDFSDDLLEAVVATQVPKVGGKVTSKSVRWWVFSVCSLGLLADGVLLAAGIGDPKFVVAFAKVIVLWMPSITFTLWKGEAQIEDRQADRWAAELLGHERIERALLAIDANYAKPPDRRFPTDYTTERIKALQGRPARKYL